MDGVFDGVVETEAGAVHHDLVHVGASESALESADAFVFGDVKECLARVCVDPF